MEDENLLSSQHFSQQGFCEGQFKNLQAIHSLQTLCSQFAECELGLTGDLSLYHTHVADEQTHRDFHFKMTQHIRASKLHEELVLENIQYFKSLVGPDIDLQLEPYLRISRPGIEEDNIGLHRDTLYGNSAYEVSCIVPLVKFVEGSAVNVLPNSQRIGPLEFTQLDSVGVTKGSQQNQIGFLYAKKHIHNLDRENLYAPLLSVGDFLMFSLCMIHGQEKNTSSITRWSIDFRFKNKFTPLNANLKNGYYQTLSSGAPTLIAQEYYSHNPEEQNLLISQQLQNVKVDSE